MLRSIANFGFGTLVVSVVDAHGRNLNGSLPEEILIAICADTSFWGSSDLGNGFMGLQVRNQFPDLIAKPLISHRLENFLETLHVFPIIELFHRILPRHPGTGFCAAWSSWERPYKYGLAAAPYRLVWRMPQSDANFRNG